MLGSAVVGIVAVNSPDFVATVFRYLDSGVVTVPLRHPEDESRIAAAGVGSVTVPAQGHGWMEAGHQPRDDDAVAQCLFTSGTEGEPKGVLLSQRALADVVTRLNDVMGVDATIREYVGVPVYSSFGFGRCRAVAAAGGRAFIPPHGFSPLEIAAMLESGAINALSAVPSLWRLLLASSALFGDFRRRLRWAEIGSQPMGRGEKEAVRALFPEAHIVEHYGLTEASRTTFLKVHRATGAELESVGCPSGGVEVRIGTGGRVHVRGPQVASAMLVDGSLSDPRDPEGWYATNDLGELKDGYLRYLGRADDLINCGGVKLQPVVLEARLRELLGTDLELTVCRIPNPVRGDGILVAVPAALDADDGAVSRAVATAAHELGASAGGAIRVQRGGELPRTDTGKVRRRKLAEDWIAGRQDAS